MSIRTSASNLAEAMKQLTQDWQRTRETWTDIKAREFESNYLEELPQQMARARQVIEELEMILKKIRTACE